MEGIHSQNDFVLIGLPESQQCTESLSRELACCDLMGGPTAYVKMEGPSTKLVFLEIELDTASLTSSLPQPKLDRLRRTIQECGDKQSYITKELLSIIGQLQHACCVVKQGRAFLWHMIELSRCVKALHHNVWLNTDFHSDFK